MIHDFIARRLRDTRPSLRALLALLVLTSALLAGQGALDREEILDTARRYQELRWRAEERHAFHGEDESGIRVDTPDVTLDASGWRPDHENVGMPYCWGGFTGLEEFEELLALDRWAGHVPERGNAMGSGRTLGVDCSGFVSRCWKLPLKQSTRSLGALCYELADYEELEPGDILNRFDAHVALFTGWEDDSHQVARVIEAARIRVEPGAYPVALLRSQGYLPMRYKPLDERWRPMPEHKAPARSAGALRIVQGFHPHAQPSAGDGSKDSSATASREDPIAFAAREGQVQPGSWVRYSARENRLTGAEAFCTWMAVPGAPGALELQRLLEVGRDSQATGATLETDAPWFELVTAFGSFSDPLRDLRLIVTDIEEGSYRIGELEFSARRASAFIEGQMLSRSTLYPVRLELACVFSDLIPLLGICEATLRLEIEYGERDGEMQLGVATRGYELREFGEE